MSKKPETLPSGGGSFVRQKGGGLKLVTQPTTPLPLPAKTVVPAQPEEA